MERCVWCCGHIKRFSVSNDWDNRKMHKKCYKAYCVFRYDHDPLIKNLGEMRIDRNLNKIMMNL